jgi:hypothetical protein
LRRYLHDETVFHDALARKWLGVDAGENGGTDRGGDAVGFLIWAKKELEELKGRKKDRVSDELETVNVFLKHYKKVNDSVSRVLSLLFHSTHLGLIATFPAGANPGGSAIANTDGAFGA